MDNELMLKVENVYKKYRLGTIGGGTLTADLQSLWAKICHKEDPNSIIGSDTYNKNEIFYALNGINFEVKKGEAVGIIGGNGAGKSTTLKLISQVTAPTKGNIYLNGRVASMLEVGTGFHPELTGRENIYMNGAILGMTKAEIDEKIEDIIDFSEVRQFIDTPVKRYSSGMYVKLAFSVAAHLDSEIMIMDEVLAVGDMQFQQKCLNKMKSLATQEGKTILYVSHNMNTIRQLCDRCIVLKNGRVIFDGDTEKAIQIYMDNYIRLNENWDFTQIKRESWLGENPSCEIHSCVVNNKNCIVNNDEELSFDLKWKSNEDIENLFLRVQFKNFGEAITTSFTEIPISCSKDHTYTYNFKIDVKNLLPATYQTVLVLYKLSSNETSIDCDCINGFSFQKISNKSIDNNWNIFRWGKTRFEKIFFER